jgi:hypothetical protein
MGACAEGAEKRVPRAGKPWVCTLWRLRRDGGIVGAMRLCTTNGAKLRPHGSIRLVRWREQWWQAVNRRPLRGVAGLNDAEGSWGISASSVGSPCAHGPPVAARRSLPLLPVLRTAPTPGRTESTEAQGAGLAVTVHAEVCLWRRPRPRASPGVLFGAAILL